MPKAAHHEAAEHHEKAAKAHRTAPSTTRRATHCRQQVRDRGAQPLDQGP